jgi:hypothetical protein
MSRRVDPERIFQARRDAIRNTLTGSGMTLEAAERYCDAWRSRRPVAAYLLPIPGVRETPR